MRVQIGSAIRELAEAREHLAGPITADHVVAREVPAHGRIHDLLPVVLVEALDGDRLGEVGGRPDHSLPDEGVAQRRRGLEDRDEIERVDDVHPEAQKAGLSPVQHLVAHAQVDGHAADVEYGAEVVVLDVAAAAHEIVGVAAQRGVAAIVEVRLKVVEPVAAHEHAEVAPLQRELAGRPKAVGHDALVVVQVSVVEIDAGRVAAVADADEVAVAALRARQQSVGDADVDQAVDLTDAKDLRLGERRRE